MTTPSPRRGACAWCRGPIPETSRRDSICCSKRCRQARHRFTTAVGSPAAVVDGHPRRLAYADPPYPGKSARYYSGHPDFAGEVDHQALIASLSAEYDAWALSTSAEALQDLLALCPPGVRVAAWHRGARHHTTAGVPLNAWEPVIYAGQIIRRASTDDGSRRPGETRRGDLVDASRTAAARRVVEDLPDASAGVPRRVDSLVYPARPRLTDPGRVVGAKPATFCRWIFDLLGAGPGDELVDVFPGSGGVARAWETFTAVQRDASRPPAGTTARGNDETPPPAEADGGGLMSVLTRTVETGPAPRR